MCLGHNYLKIADYLLNNINESQAISGFKEKQGSFGGFSNNFDFFVHINKDPNL